MNIHKLKCQRIKTLLESLLEEKDIGKRSRKRPFPEYRKMYCKLCLTFTKASLQNIGEVLGNYNHATVIHLNSKFNDLEETNGLDFLEIYKTAFKQLEQEEILFKELEDFEIPESIIELNQKYRIKLFQIIQKAHSVINNKQKQIDTLEHKLQFYIKSKS